MPNPPTAAQPFVGGRLTFDPTYRSFDTVQGGLIVGHLMRAAADFVRAGQRSAPHVGVRAVSAHFLSGVEVDVEARTQVRSNRLASTSSVVAEMWQDTAQRVTAQVLVTSNPSDGQHTRFTPADRSGIDFGNPETAEPFEVPADFSPVSQKYEIRALGAERPFLGGDSPRLAAWVRLKDPLATDRMVQLGTLADALPPSLYATLTQPVLMPTVELSLHVLGPLPQPREWLRIEQWTEWSDDTMCIDAAVMQNDQGVVAATVRQTRRILAVD